MHRPVQARALGHSAGVAQAGDRAAAGIPEAVADRARRCHSRSSRPDQATFGLETGVQWAI
eukprot:9032591-Alexandrium_andersonii.AAC.1